MKLLKIAGFSGQGGMRSSKPQRIDIIVRNLAHRLNESKKLKEECIQQITKLMKDKGYSAAQAMKYFDSDNSGSLTRSELAQGFQRMKVPLNERQLKNIMTILDQNNDNVITMAEMEDVFGPKSKKRQGRNTTAVEDPNLTQTLHQINQTGEGDPEEDEEELDERDDEDYEEDEEEEDEDMVTNIQINDFEKTTEDNLKFQVKAFKE